MTRVLAAAATVIIVLASPAHASHFEKAESPPSWQEFVGERLDLAQREALKMRHVVEIEQMREGWEKWKRDYDNHLAVEKAEHDAVAAAAQVTTVSNSGDYGSYNCGLQFADMWMSRYNIVCGDAASQIAAAEQVAAVSSGDPWPNCPDPHDGSGASWNDTVQCENSGRW